jgi:hypothetical protein
MKPIIRYEAGSGEIAILHPSARMVTHAGRAGLNFTSIVEAVVPTACRLSTGP